MTYRTVTTALLEWILKQAVNKGFAGASLGLQNRRRLHSDNKDIRPSKYQGAGEKVSFRSSSNLSEKGALHLQTWITIK